MKRLILLIQFLILTVILNGQEQTIPYTQADRDRMVRLETKVEALDKRIDDLSSNMETRFTDVDKKFDRLEDKFDSYFMWGFGMVLMSIFGLIGFIIYDRRTTLAPVENKTERVIKALRERAEKDPLLMEALKNTALW
ncbi:MAG: hypothetical protein WCP85_12215 [Mariniphaga sp.]